MKLTTTAFLGTSYKKDPRNKVGYRCHHCGKRIKKNQSYIFWEWDEWGSPADTVLHAGKCYKKYCMGELEEDTFHGVTAFVPSPKGVGVFVEIED